MPFVSGDGRRSALRKTGLARPKERRARIFSTFLEHQIRDVSPAHHERGEEGEQARLRAHRPPPERHPAAALYFPPRPRSLRAIEEHVEGAVVARWGAAQTACAAVLAFRPPAGKNTSKEQLRLARKPQPRESLRSRPVQAERGENPARARRGGGPRGQEQHVSVSVDSRHAARWCAPQSA